MRSPTSNKENRSKGIPKSEQRSLIFQPSGDTDVNGDVRNSEAGRLATINLNTEEHNESSLTSYPGMASNQLRCA